MRITHQRLQEMLRYFPSTGVWRWRVSPNNKIKAGTRAGTPTCYGYRQICVDGKIYLEHILAWFYMTGTWPKREIDHRNRKRNDNRWRNLREATPGQNRCNRIPGANEPGVSWWANRWVVKVKVNRVSHYGGRFVDIAKANNAARKLRRMLHGEFSCS